jgi:hypothetical protein
MLPTSWASMAAIPVAQDFEAVDPPWSPGGRMTQPSTYALGWAFL